MNAIAETARQNALQIEAKKDGLSQMQSGEWTLKLKIHANDIPTPLLTATMGTRYMLAMVEIGDDEEPVQQERPKSHAQEIAITCQTEGFRQFCYETFGSALDVGWSEEETIAFVRGHCGVKSRSEITHGSEAGLIWRRLRADYEWWLKT